MHENTARAGIPTTSDFLSILPYRVRNSAKQKATTFISFEKHTTVTCHSVGCPYCLSHEIKVVAFCLAEFRNLYSRSIILHRDIRGITAFIKTVFCILGFYTKTALEAWNLG